MTSEVLIPIEKPAIQKRKTFRPTFEVIAPVNDAAMSDLGDKLLVKLIKLGAMPYHWGDPDKPKDMGCVAWLKGFILVYDKLMQKNVLMKIEHYVPGMGIPLCLQHYDGSPSDEELDQLLEQSYWIYDLEHLIDQKYSKEQLASIRRRSQTDMKWRNPSVKK